MNFNPLFGLFYLVIAVIILILMFFFRHGNKCFWAVGMGSILAGIVGATPTDNVYASATVAVFATFVGYLLGRMITAAIELKNNHSKITTQLIGS